MSDLFKLQRQVSETTANISPDDVLSVKKHLKDFGYYKEPEWGMTKFTDNQMFDAIRKFQKDNHLKVDGVMKPDGETEGAFNRLLRKGGYLSSSAVQGLSLGWSDEINGAIGAVGYGLGSLNPKWNKKKESFSEAMKRGYYDYRDRERQVLKEGRKDMPVATRAAEAVGAMATPIKLSKVTKGTPLGIVDKKNLYGEVKSGIVYSMGASEDKLSDYVKNIVYGGIGNLSGHKIGNKLYGRGDTRPIQRAAISAAVNESLPDLIDWARDKWKKSNGSD